MKIRSVIILNVQSTAVLTVGDQNLWLIVSFGSISA